MLARALGHPLNFILIAALAASAFATHSWLPLAIGLVAELLWLAVARKTLPALPAAGPDAKEQATLRTLGEEDRRRYLALNQLRKELAREVRGKESFTADLLELELPKLDHLVSAFLRLAAEAARFESYARSSDLDQLEQEVRRQEKIVEKSEGAAKQVAAQNLELMQKRLAKAAEMRGRVREMRGQLSLLENTVRLLRDQIATMQTPEELTHRLDDLVRSVEAIETTQRETEAITRHLAAGVAVNR